MTKESIKEVNSIPLCFPFTVYYDGEPLRCQQSFPSPHISPFLYAFEPPNNLRDLAPIHHIDSDFLSLLWTSSEYANES